MGIDGIEFHPRYQQNLSTFQEVWLFQNFCLAQKKPPPAKSLFENTMGNQFFGTPFFGTKLSTKKIQNCNYIALYQKTAFRFDPDLGNCPNQKTRKFVYLRISCVFWFGHSFLIKCYIVTVLKKKNVVFGHYLKKNKNGFPIVF